jgi:hypothetical protein
MEGPAVKLASAVVLGAAFLVVGCGSPDADTATLENGSTSAAPMSSAEPTSTLPRVETSEDTGLTNVDPLGDVRLGPWLLVSGSVDEEPIPTEPDLELNFGRTHLFFPLSCNSGSVPYHVDGTSIEFDLDYFTTTEIRCATDPTYPPDVQAKLFETGLRRVETVTMSDNGRQLEFEGDGVTMEFFARGIGG